MNLNDRIGLFERLGTNISSYLKNGFPTDFKQAIEQSKQHNPWFTEEHILFALRSISALLEKDKLSKWLEPYRMELKCAKPAKVAVIMAGNIPLVGFHDFLCVLISGNTFIGKLSSQDKFLLPAIKTELVSIEPSIEDAIILTEEMLKGFEAVIATGSDNSSRYFEYYFGKYPHIIRKNRNSIAILNGNESREGLEALANDIFLYFGLGCRNVTKIYVPAAYNFTTLLEAFNIYKDRLSMHNKYMNNYEYNKSIYLINQIEHLDNSYCLLKEDITIASPISVLYYEYYKDLDSILKTISALRDKIQCLVAGEVLTDFTVPFGKSQQPELWDYSDGVNTLKFLIDLRRIMPI
jgi:hypothetical protein